MRGFIRAAVLTAVIAAPVGANADTVVGAGGKPGVATAWKKEGAAISLTIKEGFAAADVAAAISKGVPGAKASVDGGKVKVTGLAEDKLILALQKVEIEAGEDVNGMFAAIQNQGGGDGEEGSGSSIRATKSADMSAAMGNESGAQAQPSAPYAVTVVKVKHGRFPNVAIEVRLDNVPAEAKEGLAAGGTITLIPRIRAEKGVVDRNDAQSKKNAGAWYIRPGDKISVKLEGKGPQDSWVAADIERKPR